MKIPSRSKIIRMAQTEYDFGFPRPGVAHQLYKTGCDLAPFTDGELQELTCRMLRGEIPAPVEEYARVRQTFRDRRIKASSAPRSS